LKLLWLKIFLIIDLKLKEMSIKATRIIFWITTGIIFIFEGIIPALTGHTELAKEGIRHLGYPEYFGTMLVIFKVLGALSLIIPKIPNRIKEWAYAGFAIDFISAFVSHWVIDGFGGQAVFPLFVLAILIISYLQYNKLNKPFGSNS
jgi:hypothetical protein